ncbi:MAG: dTMP kinase [Candidatus Acidiferrales bacterium]
MTPANNSSTAGVGSQNGRQGKSAPKAKNGRTNTGTRFYGTPLPGVNPEELSGSLIVVEGTDGSGRSTQISLVTEWLESEGFAVETMGLRRSFLVGEDIDALLAENAVTRMTLALMYSTDFFDQLERRILPALRSGLIVLADRYIFTLIARAAVRGIGRDYLHGIYEIALRPDLTFWLDVRPEVAFDREFKKSQTISYWESGRDMSLSNDLFQSFIRYQSMIKREFEYLSQRHGFLEIDGEASVSEVNRQLRKKIASHLGIRSTHYRPSHALAHLWR